MTTRPIDRALLWAKEDGLNQSDLAKRLSVLPQDITNWKKRDLPSDKYLAVADVLNRSLDDLLGRSSFLRRGGAELKTLRESVALFDVLDVQAACGDGVVNGDYPEVMSTLSMPLSVAQKMLGTSNRSNSVKIVMAARDSMVPTINPEDLLFVDISITEYVSEGIYLLVHDSDLVCKRLSRPGKEIVVTSDNKTYPPWKWLDRPDNTRIVGRVLRALPIEFKIFGGEA